MKKKIRSGKNIGIAEQVQGLEVEVVPHPIYKDVWRFNHNGEIWMATDYAFENETE